MNILELTEDVLGRTRKASHKDIKALARTISHIEFHYMMDNDGVPLVAGEAGPVRAKLALERIVQGRTKKEGGGPVSSIEAWMQAEPIAASVAAGHEYQTSELVSPATQAKLQEAFAKFALQHS